jgi:hypothetical protein
MANDIQWLPQVLHFSKMLIFLIFCVVRRHIMLQTNFFSKPLWKGLKPTQLQHPFIKYKTLATTVCVIHTTKVCSIYIVVCQILHVRFQSTYYCTNNYFKTAWFHQGFRRIGER